jgi:hypothetical protein
MIRSMSSSDMLKDTIEALPAITMSTAACSAVTPRAAAISARRRPARPSAPRPDATTIDAAPPRRRTCSFTISRNTRRDSTPLIASVADAALSPGITAAARLVDDAS